MRDPLTTSRTPDEKLHHPLTRRPPKTIAATTTITNRKNEVANRDTKKETDSRNKKWNKHGDRN
jgi:hypothetical protein